MSASDLAQRLEQAQQRAKKLRGQIEQHYSRVSAKSLRAYAEAAGVESLDHHTLQPLRTLAGHFGKVYAMHWAGEAFPFNLVSASQDGKLIVWNAFTANKIHAIPLRSAWVMTCAYEPVRGQMVACGGLDNLCSVYRLDAEPSPGTPSVELAQHDGYLSCTRFVDETRVITSSGDSSCILWDVATGQALRTFGDHSADVMSVSVAPDRNTFVSGSCDVTAKLWDLRESRCAKTFIGHVSDINSVAFFPDGNMFATGSDDSSCRLFDIRACGQVADFVSEQLMCGITSIAFSRSGRLLFAGADDKKCYVWDVLHQRKQGEDLVGHDGRVSCVDVSVDGRALGSGSWDTTLKVWSATC
mmetsp:Transcript_23342/g.75179  ORF Transcript_23342/g.75179 Transcript_23342/m.75179 type:complete len:356 (-) Transcript_23342:139-1206(-)